MCNTVIEVSQGDMDGIKAAIDNTLGELLTIDNGNGKPQNAVPKWQEM